VLLRREPPCAGVYLGRQKLRQQAADEAAALPLPKMKERLNCRGVGGQRPNGSYISSGLLNVQVDALDPLSGRMGSSLINLPNAGL